MRYPLVPKVTSPLVDAYASRAHYLTHLRPVFDALPDEIRGTLYLGRNAGGTFHPGPELLCGGGRVLVASYTDHAFVAPHRRTILMQHGTGQSYAADERSATHPSYAGGDGNDGVEMFLVPGPHPVARWRQRYPDAAVAEIGDPALDAWLRTTRRPRVPRLKPVVALSWRWEANGICAETSSALQWFLPALEGLCTRYDVIGHSHPRARGMVQHVYEYLGIPVVDYDTVMLRADVVACDNTSMGWEALALGIPTIWLSPPAYRPGIDHGLRFTPSGPVAGTEVRDRDSLVDAVETTLAAFDPATTRRALRGVYTYLDGRSAQRGADAIAALVASDRETAMLATTGVTP